MSQTWEENPHFQVTKAVQYLHSKYNTDKQVTVSLKQLIFVSDRGYDRGSQLIQNAENKGVPSLNWCISNTIPEL